MTIAEKPVQEDGYPVRRSKQGVFGTACGESALLLCSRRLLKVQESGYKSCDSQTQQQFRCKQLNSKLMHNPPAVVRSIVKITAGGACLL